MGKCANVLKMLMILRSRHKMKTRKIANRLEVDPRMIRKYKKVLEQLGVYIESTPGRYGGYSIGVDNTILNLGIDEQEFSVLKNAETYLKQEGFVFIKEYKTILDKINSNLKNNQRIKDVNDLILESIPNINLEKEKDKYINIQEAVMTSNKVKIEYFSLTSGLKDRVIRPYALYVYQGFWYVMAYCELRDAIRQFKLPRIRKMEILKEEFKKPEDFSLNEYLENTIGIIYDEDKFNVKLKIEFPTSIKVSERIWVKDQKVTFNEDNSIIFEAEMTGLDDIVNWVLSLGSDVKVIEPLELKEQVKEEAREILKNN
ncbi:helix-turn-helix transcriptional regulator [Sporohalobacter salinus]|uniref:helix-turn-helix transcriptional regulator n=1 Tax=Sporohalobacter salinus TaxID=1494606 RepID=UPI001960C979|nr:transcriptional regulator [Sporohalobacter salinus]MBM7623760.1 putative DNA-binding transcriptional regulator YafY [Sporohalobacter salinus]